MNALTWIAQLLLALIFTSVGIMKISQPVTRLTENMGWVSDFPALFVRILGFVEIALGLFIILPKFLKAIPSSFTTYAGYGILMIMVGAIAINKIINYNYIIHAGEKEMNRSFKTCIAACLELAAVLVLEVRF